MLRKWCHNLSLLFSELHLQLLLAEIFGHLVLYTTLIVIDLLLLTSIIAYALLKIRLQEQVIYHHSHIKQFNTVEIYHIFTALRTDMSTWTFAIKWYSREWSRILQRMLYRCWLCSKCIVRNVILLSSIRMPSVCLDYEIVDKGENQNVLKL